MMRQSPTATKQSLDATINRILGQVRIMPDDEALGPPIKCVRCKDAGVIEWVAGNYTTPRGRSITASPEKPVFTQCDCVKRAAEDEPRPRRSFSARDAA